MSHCCRTCTNRKVAINTFPSAPSKISVYIITLAFRFPITSTSTNTSVALNTLLNDIFDSSTSTPNPSTFTVWSPCNSFPNTVVIITTVSETCSSATAPVFDVVRDQLEREPNIQHVYLDRSVVSLSASSPEERISVDLVQLHAPTLGVAVAMGKCFGWDPTRSSLSAQPRMRASASFVSPGDLVRDFWAWAELPWQFPATSPLSSGSYEELPFAEPVLVSTNPDENRLNSKLDESKKSLPIPKGKDDAPPPYTTGETLNTLFQWSSRADGERFKDPMHESLGPHGDNIATNTWSKQVADPVARLKQLGARVETRSLELRGVEPRVLSQKGATDKKGNMNTSRTKRLSLMASGLSEKVSGLWK